MGKRSSQSHRDDNILSAVMLLLNEFDKNSLELIHKEVGKKLKDM